MQKENVVESCYEVKVERGSRGKYPINSKTFWVAVVCIVLGVYLVKIGDRNNGVQLILFGLGLLGIRDAIRKIC